MSFNMGISVDDLEDGKSIYVKNNSEGDFLLTVYHTGGSKSELVPIPKTFIPIRITDFATPKMFKESTDFRKSLSKGIIEFVPEEEAIEELKEDDSIMEMDRLRRIFFNNKGYKENVTAIEAIKSVSNNKVNHKVRDILLRDDISDNDKLAILIGDNKSNPFSEHDFEFMIVTCDENSKITNWAKKNLDNTKNKLFKKSTTKKKSKNNE